MYGLVRAVKPKLCLESGTFQGDGAIAIAEALRENANGGKLYTVDYKDFGTTDKLHQYENMIVVRGTSPQVFQTLDLKGLDFVFLDSGHDFGQVMRELRAIDSIIEPSGYILVHDVLHSNWGEGASKAIQDFMRERPNQYSYIYLTSYNGLGILQKIGYTENSNSFSTAEGGEAK
jgi:predicted O-methyltransferase YrrM